MEIEESELTKAEFDALRDLLYDDCVTFNRRRQEAAPSSDPESEYQRWRHHFRRAQRLLADHLETGRRRLDEADATAAVLEALRRETEEAQSESRAISEASERLEDVARHVNRLAGLVGRFAALAV